MSKTPAIKCRRCGRFIVRNTDGEWVLPGARYPSPLCLDGTHPHDPDEKPGNDQSGLVMGVAIGSSIAETGLI